MSSFNRNICFRRLTEHLRPAKGSDVYLVLVIKQVVITIAAFAAIPTQGMWISDLR